MGISSSVNVEPQLHSIGLSQNSPPHKSTTYNERRGSRMKVIDVGLSNHIIHGVSTLIDAAVHTHTINTITTTSTTNEYQFKDSIFIKHWLNTKEANYLYSYLKEIGDKVKPLQLKNASQTYSKYPLWTTYYGLPRKLDNAVAFDRWGSNYESWIRIEQPPEVLTNCCDLLRIKYQLPEYALNSMVVNYYYDGENTYIPAHRDTVACLEDGSSIYCLSLGATRDFILCDKSDAGKYNKSDMQVIKEFPVSHGDLFVLGPHTNQEYCHAVPKENTVTKLRISIIFRTVTRSFINLHSCNPSKEAIYTTGKIKLYSSICITTKDINDIGIKEHLSDLINIREKRKQEKKQQLLSTTNNNKATTTNSSNNNNNNNKINPMIIATKHLASLTADMCLESYTPTTFTLINNDNNDTDIIENKNIDDRSSNNDIDNRNNKELDENLIDYYLGAGSAVPQI